MVKLLMSKSKEHAHDKSGSREIVTVNAPAPSQEIIGSTKDRTRRHLGT